MPLSPFLLKAMRFVAFHYPVLAYGELEKWIQDLEYRGLVTKDEAGKWIPRAYGLQILERQSTEEPL